MNAHTIASAITRTWQERHTAPLPLFEVEVLQTDVRRFSVPAASQEDAIARVLAGELVGLASTTVPIGRAVKNVERLR